MGIVHNNIDDGFSNGLLHMSTSTDDNIIQAPLETTKRGNMSSQLHQQHRHEEDYDNDELSPCGILESAVNNIESAVNNLSHLTPKMEISARDRNIWIRNPELPVLLNEINDKHPELLLESDGSIIGEGTKEASTNEIPHQIQTYQATEGSCQVEQKPLNLDLKCQNETVSTETNVRVRNGEGQTVASVEPVYIMVQRKVQKGKRKDEKGESKSIVKPHKI
jgi:hypothetical protein